MAGVRSLVFLTGLMWAAASDQPDVTVYVQYMSNRILRCKFESGNTRIIYWSKDGKDNMVHRYKDGVDQLKDQMPEFAGRTSLFHAGLLSGDASLLLKKVQVSDAGLYRCYTSRLVNDNLEQQESFINLEVFAPVAEVSIVQEGENITCRSEGIYPEPQVTWSRNKMADTRIEQTEQQLYNIRSSVRLDDGGDYSCNIRSLRSSRRATLTITSVYFLFWSKWTLDCPALKSPPMSVTWRFYDLMILQREDDLDITESWKDHVKDLSTSGSLTLQNLTLYRSGIYSCEVTNVEETLVKIIYVIIQGTTETMAMVWAIVATVLAVGWALCFFLYHRP